MSGYLGRLKGLLAETREAHELTKPPKAPFVGFVSDAGSHDCEAEAAIQERAGLASGGVPAVYLDVWARLNCQKPLRVSEDEWRLALNDGGLFLDAWGEEAEGIGWTPGDLFDVGNGLIWSLGGAHVEVLGGDHARLSDGRTWVRIR